MVVRIEWGRGGKHRSVGHRQKVVTWNSFLVSARLLGLANKMSVSSVYCSFSYTREKPVGTDQDLSESKALVTNSIDLYDQREANWTIEQLGDRVAHGTLLYQ